MLGEGLNDDINGSIGTAEKRFSINLSKTNEKFYLSLACFLFIDRKEIYKFKVDHKKKQFPNSVSSRTHI